MFAFLAVAALVAAPPLRLSDLLREAREKNPELRALEAESRAAGASVAPMGALEDPMLMLQLWNAPADLKQKPVMVQLTQNIPLGGKRKARRSAADAMRKGADAELAAKRLDVEEQVAQAYFDLFMAERTGEIDAEIERTAHAMMQAAATRVAAGKGEQVETLRAQAEILKVQADEETAAAQRIAAQSMLIALLDRDPTEPLGNTSAPGLLPTLPPLGELRVRAMEGRPELVSASAMIARADADLALAKAMRVPDVQLQAGEMHMFGAMPDEQSEFLFAGVQLNLPIFRRRLGGERTAAALRAEAARSREKAMRNEIAAQVGQAYAQVEAEARILELHHKLIPVDRQELDAALSGYSAGKVDFIMVVDGLRDLQMHELDLAMHTATYEHHVAELQRAVGADLGLAAAAESPNPEHH